MTGAITVHNMFVDYGKAVRELYTDVKIGKSFEGDTPGNPFPIRLKAIWDTGATGTAISDKLVQNFGLVQAGELDIQGVTGRETCPTYLVSLFLPNDVVLNEIEASSFSADIGCDVLIGMDVIGQGDFAICNKGGRTTFTFRIPSIDYINFTTQNPKAENGAILSPIIPGRNAPCPCGSGKKYKNCCGK